MSCAITCKVGDFSFQCYIVSFSGKGLGFVEKIYMLTVKTCLGEIAIFFYIAKFVSVYIYLLAKIIIITVLCWFPALFNWHLSGAVVV